MMSSTKLIAVRDPHGFRPLCYGKMKDGTYIVASESCALHAVGAEFQRDILPGEILTFDCDGIHSDTSHCGTAPKKMCIFEYIYFARPDSYIEGVSVHASRRPIRWTRTLSSACRIPDWTPPWAMPGNRGFPTASA